MPAIVKVRAGETPTFAGYVNGSAKVYGLANNGTMGTKYEVGTQPDETHFTIDSNGAFTTPTDANETQYIVVFDRKVSSGIAIYNRADKFPGTVKLILKVLAIEPCTADTLRAGYLVLPSFQVSPEVSLGLTTD